VIPADRFIAPYSDRYSWAAARAVGVTATAVARAATPAGFRDVAAELGKPDELIEGNPYFDFGHEQEPLMMRHAKSEFGIMPNDWLIAGSDPLHLATPDGLSLDHEEIAEAKTTGTDWELPPIKYRRQIQWQLHVTGAKRGLLVWALRVPDDRGWFFCPWLEPKTRWIDRDESMISELVDVASRLLALKEAA
jgi:hypothetical protein